MKKRILLTGLVVGQLLFGQYTQVINQVSDGGTAWGEKFTAYDAELPYASMPAFDLDALVAEDVINDTQKGMYRFGHNHYTDLRPSNSGVWTTLDNGDKVWRLGITSNGALSINLALQYVSLVEGARLFFYNTDRSFKLGAFTQKHISDDYQFGTELITGDSIIVELYEPSSAVGTSEFQIFRVTHRYRGVDGFLDRAFGDAGSCNNNVNCPIGSAYTNQRNAVVCLVSGGSGFCTGTLINNTCNDGRPFVLTANHCGSSGFGTWVFRFNWQASGCPNPGSSPSSNSISGGTQRAAHPGADMSLVEINGATTPTTIASYGGYYAGWDRNNVTTTNPYCIHHPSGDIKKLSLTTGTTSTATYGGATCWQTPTWTDGITEPGSSGSALFNSAGLIIGQLYGGPSNCGCENNATCGYDYYGKIFTSWTGGGTAATRLSDWLNPSTCPAGSPTTWSGYDPNAASITWDANLTAITSPANGSTTCNTTINPVINWTNSGTNTITSININYSINGAAAVTFAWTGSLATGASTTVNLPSYTAPAGANTYQVTMGNPNGNPDGNTANQTLTNSFTVISGAGTPIPFSEGFEGATFPPASWTNVNPTGIGFARTTAAGASSTASSWLNYYSDNTGELTRDFLTTPFLSFAAAANPQLTFDVAHRQYNAVRDSLSVQISTNCGATWTTVYQKGSNTLATVTPSSTATFTPTSAQWRNEVVSLTAYASQPSVQIRFVGYSAYGNNIYLDNINITNASTSAPTASFTSNDNNICAGQTVTFTNTSSGATSISWSFPGGSPASSTTSPVTVTYASAGSYTATLTATNAFGTNNSNQTITVNANPTPTATIAGSTVSTTTTYTTYQWYRNGVLIPGATSQNYTITMGGSYTCVVTDANGCSGTSNAVVSTLGIENILSDLVNVYPNPASNFITISNSLGGEYTIELMNMLGEVINSTVVNTTNYSMDISSIANGSYIVRISQNNLETSKRIIVIK